VARVAQLHRDGEIEAGRSGADAGDFHPVTRESCQSWHLNARAREGEGDVSALSASARNAAKTASLRVRVPARAREALIASGLISNR
jgi:hypothetical protein